MTININEKFAFLTSSRFWAICIGAVSAYLRLKGYIGDAEVTLIATIVGGFTVVRTVDRISDKKVEAANITAGNIVPTLPLGGEVGK